MQKQVQIISFQQSVNVKRLAYNARSQSECLKKKKIIRTKFNTNKKSISHSRFYQDNLVKTQQKVGDKYVKGILIKRQDLLGQSNQKQIAQTKTELFNNLVINFCKTKKDQSMIINCQIEKDQKNNSRKVNMRISSERNRSQLFNKNEYLQTATFYTSPKRYHFRQLQCLQKVLNKIVSNKYRSFFQRFKNHHLSSIRNNISSSQNKLSYYICSNIGQFQASLQPQFILDGNLVYSEQVLFGQQRNGMKGQNFQLINIFFKKPKKTK